MPSLQDYSLIENMVKKYGEDYEIGEPQIAFYFFALDHLLGLQDDEIKEAITDTYYLQKYGTTAGHDRGIDAVYIDSGEKVATIHLFNFKYSLSFDKLKDFLESNEIDKMLGFLGTLMLRDQTLLSEVNSVLSSKVEEIWDIFNKQNPAFVFHICSNHYVSFEKSQKDRFERGVNLHSNFTIEYDLMDRLVEIITRRGKKQVDARIKAIDKNFFEKSDGEIRAMIVNLDAKDILRIVINDDDLRNQPDLSDYSVLRHHNILEDAFEDNVRIYLKQRSKINRNIKATAISDDNYKFFYYNNGLTITCDHFSYPKSLRAPIIEIKNLQIVNGGQTVHALYDALCEDCEKIININLLCRLYETRDKDLSSRIAEFTNSQNQVNNRDIHSIDTVQIKVESDLLALGYHYERKKNQHSEQIKPSRIDSEKVGQALLAFQHGMPSEAKNQKRIIFGEKYDDIFSDTLTAKEVLLVYDLYQRIENEKNTRKADILNNYEEYGYLSYTTYWILFIMKRLAEDLNMTLSYENVDEIFAIYPFVIAFIESMVKDEKEKLKNKNEKYIHSIFFKYNAPKKYFEKYIESEAYGVLLKRITQN